MLFFLVRLPEKVIVLVYINTKEIMVQLISYFGEYGSASYIAGKSTCIESKFTLWALALIYRVWRKFGLRCRKFPKSFRSII